MGLLHRVSLRAHQFRQRHDANIFCEFVGFVSRIDDAQFVELQVGQRNAHGRCERGRVGAFALDADAAAVLEEQEIEFRALVRGPEICLTSSRLCNRLASGCLKRKLGEHPAEFLAALVAAMNDRTKLPTLDSFSELPEQSQTSSHSVLANSPRTGEYPSVILRNIPGFRPAGDGRHPGRAAQRGAADGQNHAGARIGDRARCPVFHHG